MFILFGGIEIFSVILRTFWGLRRLLDLIYDQFGNIQNHQRFPFSTNENLVDDVYENLQNCGKLTLCSSAKLQSGLLAFCIGISILSRSKHSVTRGLKALQSRGKKWFLWCAFQYFLVSACCESEIHNQVSFSNHCNTKIWGH